MATLQVTKDVRIAGAEFQAVLYALRTFIRDYDGKPASPATPSQADVNLAKEALAKLY